MSYAILGPGVSYCTTGSGSHPSRDEPVKCDYCGRYGALGQCEGCGAPNKPAAHGYQRIDVTHLGSTGPEYRDVYRLWSMST